MAVSKHGGPVPGCPSNIAPYFLGSTGSTVLEAFWWGGERPWDPDSRSEPV